MKPKTDNEELIIVGRMMEGDRDAFKYFFNTYYSDLCNFVLIYLKDRVLSEDVVQDIFVYFWESRNKIKIQSSVKAYLFSASKFKSLNLIRDQRIHNQVINKLVQNEVVSDSIEVEYFDNAAQMKQILSDAINGLPERCGQIFKLSKNENLSNKEIAELLGVSIKTVENQMTIALRKLRETLQPYREKLFILFLIHFFMH